jgi:hypothetical protein
MQTKQTKLSAELTASFEKAPAELRAMITSRRRPLMKTHADIEQKGKAAEADPRLHSNPNHACKQGYHRRGVFTKHYPGYWDAARCFFACTSHSLKNVVYNIFSLVAGTGKVAFTDKRKRIEAALGRIEYLGGGVKSIWEAGRRAKETRTGPRSNRGKGKGEKRAKAARRRTSRPAQADSGGDGEGTDDEDATDSELTESDEPASNRLAPSSSQKKWYTMVRFPFEASESDHAVFGHLQEQCKFWAGKGGSHLFSFPDTLDDLLTEMKIHHAYVLGGMVGEYIIHRCRGLSAKVCKLG